MKCIFCENEMVGFHICASTVQNMSLRPDGAERFGYVTFGEVPPNKVLHPTPESGGTLSAVESNSENALPA